MVYLKGCFERCLGQSNKFKFPAREDNNVMVDISFFLDPIAFKAFKSFVKEEINIAFQFFVSETFLRVLEKEKEDKILLLAGYTKSYMPEFYIREYKNHLRNVREFLAKSNIIKPFSYEQFKSELFLNKIEKTNFYTEISLDEVVFLLEKSILISISKRIFNKFRKLGVFPIDMGNIFKSYKRFRNYNFHSEVNFGRLKTLKKVAKYIALGINCFQVPMLSTILSAYECMTNEIKTILKMVELINITQESKFLYILLDP
jgi:hypothetical protein